MDLKANLFIGTYSQGFPGLPGNGEGIYRCSVNLITGELSIPVCEAECLNPSYLAMHESGKYLYATKEVYADQSPAIHAFEISETGRLSLIGSASIDGEIPCHISVDETGKYLASAQYQSGDTVLFELMPDGQVGNLLQKILHQGSGPNTKRQEGPHAHFVHFLKEPNALVIADLGLDRVFEYRFDPASSALDLPKVLAASLNGGAGPRHLVNVPNTNKLFVLCELSEHIVLLERNRAGWHVEQIVEAFSEDKGNQGSGAAIRLSPDGQFLYISLRSQSEIVCFAIDPETQQLSFVERISSGGICPRDFSPTPCGRFIVVANQMSNALTCFSRDPMSGRLKETGFTVDVGSPVCVLF